MIVDRPSPVRLTAAAAQRLPRWVLLGLLALFVLPGLGGHEPWGEDALGFGLMWTMAHGGPADFWLPNVAGAVVASEGPLGAWAGALSIRLLGAVLGDPLASKLACVASYALTAAALWYGTLRLARLPEAQPISLAFGGEADARDYRRMVADIAVLLLVATLGLVARAHETTAETFALAAASVATYGLALSLARPLAGAAVTGLGAGALALARSPVDGLGLLLGCAAAWLLLRRRVVRRAAASPVEPVPDLAQPARRPQGPTARGRLTGLLLATALAVALFALWPLGAWSTDPARAASWFTAWRTWLAGETGLVGLDDLSWVARNASWQLWPLWPLAAWALYAWRHDPGAPHIALPALVAAGVATVGAYSSPLADASVVPMVPALAMLGAFGVATQRRATSTLVDGFSVTVFTLFLAFVWSYWFAMTTGTPRAMAASVARLTPGFVPAFEPSGFAAALLVTVGWFALVAWRVRQHAAPLWRVAVIGAGGIVALWVVTVALFWPAIDYNRSHSRLAREIAYQVGVLAPGSCVQAHRVPPAYRGLVAYFGPVRFGRDDSPEACDVALHRDTARSALDDDPPPGSPETWRVVWEAPRPGRPDERWRLWVRTPY